MSNSLKKIQGGRLHDMGIGNGFMAMALKAQAMEEWMCGSTSNYRASAQQRERSTDEEVTHRMGENSCKPSI